MINTIMKPAFWRNAILSVFVTGLFLWLALRDVDVDTIKEVFANIRWVYLPLPFIAWGIGMVARTMRWYLLLNRQIDFLPTMHILNIGFLINATIPLRIGELLRVYLVKKQKRTVSVWTTLTTVATERILDTVAVVILLLVVLPFLPLKTNTIVAGLVFGLIGLGGFFTLLWFAHKPGFARWILNLVQRILPFLKRFNLERLLEKLLVGIYPLTNWRTLFNVLFWTSMAWGASVAAAWATALLFSELVPQTDLIRTALTLAIVATSFSLIVPFTMASVGPFEAAVIFALGTIGIKGEVSLAYGVIFHAAMIVHFVIWGSLGVVNFGLSFADFSQIRHMQLTPNETDAAQ